MPKGEKAEAISLEQLERYAMDAAKAAGHEEGFGVKGCDLSKPTWWAAYVRQSLEEQAQNSRVPDYLRTCAQEAKRLGVVVPREYILYDAVTGEHLERPNMIRLRRLVSERRIAGVVFPALDRLSREPLHQGIFELEAAHYGVRLHYADAPSGNDPGSQFARSILLHAAKLVKLANRKNARGGNIGRVVKGWVPASRAPYGYTYRADREIGADGKVAIKKAWWEIDRLDSDGEPLLGSSAWVVAQIFTWIGVEGRSLYWAADRLNEMGITAPEGGRWSPARVSYVLHHRCYTGNHAYNTAARVPNPSRPLGDITAEIRRTLRRPKPQEEWIAFKVPSLVAEGLWEKANAQIAERGRGRGKQGKSIRALLRNRLFCPKCGKPMIVRRDGRQNRVYYHCSKYFRPWLGRPCDYRKFIPSTWDDHVWDAVCAFLRDDSWLELQLASQQCQDENAAKLARLQEYRISQAHARIAKIRDGFEGGIYSLEDAKRRIADQQATMTKAEEAKQLLEARRGGQPSTAGDLEAVKRELKALRDSNLEKTAFNEKLDILARLGVKVYPSEDLKAMRVVCQLNINPEEYQADCGSTKSGGTPSQASGQRDAADGCGKVMFGSPSQSIDRTPDIIFKAVFAFA